MSRTKDSTQDSQSHPWIPVGLAIGPHGVDLRTSPKARSPELLEELKNAVFRDEKTVTRRPGHEAHEVYFNVEVGTKAKERGVTDSGKWLLGHGSLLTDGTPTPPTDIDQTVSGWPGQVLGAFRRDSETVVWTGDRLLTLAEPGDIPWYGGSTLWSEGFDQRLEYGIPAVMPATTAAVVPAEVPLFATHDTSYDHCLGETYAMSAWSSSLGAPVRVCITERETGAVAYAGSLGSGGTAASVKCVYSGGFLVVYWWDSDNDVILRTFCSEGSPSEWSEPESTASCQDGAWDVEYVNAQLHLLVWVDNGDVLATYWRGANEGFFPFIEGTTIESGLGTVTALGASVAPNGDIGLIWQVADEVFTRVYLADGTPRHGSPYLFSSFASEDYPAVTIAPRWFTTDVPIVEEEPATGYLNFGTDSGVQFTAIATGTGGNGVEVDFVADTSLYIAEAGNVLTIYFDNNAKPTPAEVLAVVNGFSTLVTGEAVGTDPAEDSASVTLSGGVDYEPATFAGSFIGYCNLGDSDTYSVRSRNIRHTGVSGGQRRYACLLASRAFRVGDQCGVWCLGPYNLSFVDDPETIVPTVLFLMVGREREQRVAGFAEYGTSYNASFNLSSVRPDPRLAYGTPGEPTTARWSLATAGRFRVAGAFSEYATLTARTLDFLPEALRSAQFGRATYLAGAALHAYDGASLVEVGFAGPPSVLSFVQSEQSGGELEIDGSLVYRYRVYAVWQNAHGETCRSPAYTVAAPVLTGDNNALTIRVRTMPFTNKAGVVFEVYRTEIGGTNYHYVGSTPVNNNEIQYVSFLDTASDESLLTKPVDPHNPAVGQPSELEEALPRGCAVVIAGQDRLWLSGGDVPPGEVVFSKVKEIGEMAGFSDQVGSVIVAEDGGDIVSLAIMNEGLVAFQRDKIRFLQGSGPDNLGSGFFAPSALVMGPGASTHEGTCNTDLGVVYWSDKGPQLLGTGLQVANIGAPVLPLASTLRPSGVAAPNGLREVRWYTRTGTALLMDYLAGAPRWAVWSGLQVAGVALRGAGRPDLVTLDGTLLRESTDMSTDGGRPFEFAFTTGELRPDDIAMGKNQVRYVGLLGVYEGPHTLRVQMGYNGSLYWNERFTWNPELDLGATPIADIPGPISDYESPATSPDGVYRFVRRINKNPMSTVRLRFSDGAAAGPSFIPQEVTLELGALDGLANVPVRRFDGRTAFEE